HGVDDGIGHERGARIVEVADVPASRRLCTHAVEVDGHERRLGHGSHESPRIDRSVTIRAIRGYSPTRMRCSTLLPRISGTYMAWPTSGSAWKTPGASARTSYRISHSPCGIFPTKSATARSRSSRYTHAVRVV